MKKIDIVISTSAIAMLLFISSCTKDDAAPTPADLGTFAGSIQVADDPQTQLGYIYNAKVAVTISASTATIKVTGDLGFDREYTGTVATAQAGIYNITINKQTKPTQKIAGESLQILNNTLTVSLSVASDNVSVIKSNSTQTIQIAGKLGMIGTGLLKQ